VGGGRVALDKVTGLLTCGAHVTVVAPRVVDGLERLEREGRVHLTRRRYEPGDTDGAFVVVAATDDLDVNLGVYAAAAGDGALVNVVNAPLASDFLVPAVVRADELTIAISTTGASPALARRLKREIAEQYAGASARN
jgi:precorrin-2 dehydrogenase / sirohydrochlorin ferrochelatase